MHLLVLSAFRLDGRPIHALPYIMSQCTFWCSVLSDVTECVRDIVVGLVSMHLLVLSAFRQNGTTLQQGRISSLNAPSGAQCFPTGRADCCRDCCHVSMHLLVLSAFRHRRQPLREPHLRVSMHLLVLSAFRLRPQKTAPQRRLPERNRRRPGKHHIESARTCPIKPHNREKPPQTTPAPPTPPTSRYATGFQRTRAKKPTPHNYAAVNTATKATDDCPLQTRRTASR